MGWRNHWRFHFNVGLKVASTVIFFELLMVVTYVLVTDLVFADQTLVRLLNLDRQNLIIVILVSSLVLAGYLTYMIITRIFRPVSVLAKATEQLMKGNLDFQLQVTTGDELQQLAEGFNAMASALKAERESLEKKVLERTQALEQAQRTEIERQTEVLKLKDEFLFVAAHELRTPVTAIRWSLESVSDRRMSADIRGAFDDAVGASKSLGTLVEDLLNMARLDAKRIPFKKEFVNLAEAAQSVLKELEPIALKRRVSLAIELPEGFVPMALADGRRVDEVLVNLVSNAIKYNREGGHVRIQIAREDGFLRYDVIDDGPGIAKEEQKHLFEKFWRAKTSGAVEGSGLGLFIVKRLVEGMNGKITFLSIPGKQTTFSVRLPAAQS